MKKFLIKIVRLTVVGLLLFIGIGLFVDAFINEKVLSTQKMQQLFDYKTLIVGDSHTQCALNPDLIPYSINISNSFENLYFTYNILNTLINQYQITPENIILGVSFHSFSLAMDSTLFDKQYSNEKYKRYSLAINDDDFLVLKRWDKSFIFNLAIRKMHLLTRNNVTLLRKYFTSQIEINDIPYCGRFYRSEKSNLETQRIDGAIQRHFETNKHYKSKIQLDYLNKIALLCMQKKINLFLLNAPIYKSYKDKIPDIYITSYYKEIDKYLNMKNVYFMDYSNFILPDSCYGDGDHLNSKGACILSPIICKEINSRPLKSAQ